MHHRTELSLVDEFRWVSPLHYLKKRMTESCSFLVHVASGVAIFKLLLRRRVAFLHRTATWPPLFKPSVSLLSIYRQSSCVWDCYRSFDTPPYFNYYNDKNRRYCVEIHWTTQRNLTCCSEMSTKVEILLTKLNK